MAKVVKKVAKKAAPKKAVPKKAVPKKAVPKKAVPKKAVPKKAVPKKAVPKKAVPKKAVPKKAVPKKAAPKKPAKKAVPKKASKKSAPKKINNHNTIQFDLGRLGNVDVVIHDEQGKLEIQVEDVYGFVLYKGETLRDVMETIDVIPQDYKYLNANQIMNYVNNQDLTYEQLLDTNLCLDSIDFIDEMLNQVNKHDAIVDGKIQGEERFYGIYDTFNDFDDDDSETEQKIVKAFKEIQKIVIDRKGLIKSMLNDKGQGTLYDNDNLYYIVSFNCLSQD